MERQVMDEGKLGPECRNEVGPDIVYDFDFFICLCGQILEFGTYASKF